MQISTSARLSFGLVMLTVSILLSAHIMGLVPDQKKAIVLERERMTESLAVYCANAAEKNDLKTIEDILKLLVDRNEDILSAAVRKVDGTVLAMSGNHEKNWQEALPDTSTPTHIRIPIYKDEKLWCHVEVVFTPLKAKGIWGVLSNPLVKLVLFMLFFGFVFFRFFLKRTLSHIDPSSVVPPRVKTALDTLSEGVVLIDKSGRIVLANETFAAKTGIPPSQLTGRKMTDMKWRSPSTDMTGEVYPWNMTLQSKEKQTGFQLILETQLGEVRTFMVNSTPIIDGNGSSRGVLATFDDVTQLEEKNEQLKLMVEELEKSSDKIKQQNKELEFLATRDPLTGCRNRRSFFEVFEKNLSSSKRYGHELSCVMFDIDHFKSINDTHGHAAGDDVLKGVSDTVRLMLREADTIGRYGGEEFCVILPHTDIENAAIAAERYRKGIEARNFSGISVTASFGVSSMLFGAKDPKALIDEADRSLYSAKHGGRNRVVTFKELSSGSLPVELPPSEPVEKKRKAPSIVVTTGKKEPEKKSSLFEISGPGADESETTTYLKESLESVGQILKNISGGPSPMTAKSGLGSANFGKPAVQLKMNEDVSGNGNGKKEKAPTQSRAIQEVVEILKVNIR